MGSKIYLRQTAGATAGVDESNNAEKVDTGMGSGRIIFSSWHLRGSGRMAAEFVHDGSPSDLITVTTDFDNALHLEMPSSTTRKVVRQRRARQRHNVLCAQVDHQPEAFPVRYLCMPSLAR